MVVNFVAVEVERYCVIMRWDSVEDLWADCGGMIAGLCNYRLDGSGLRE